MTLIGHPGNRVGAEKVERIGPGPEVTGGLAFCGDGVGRVGAGAEAVELALSGDLGEYRQVRIFRRAE